MGAPKPGDYAASIYQLILATEPELEELGAVRIDLDGEVERETLKSARRLVQMLGRALYSGDEVVLARVEAALAALEGQKPAATVAAASFQMVIPAGPPLRTSLEPNLALAETAPIHGATQRGAALPFAGASLADIAVRFTLEKHAVVSAEIADAPLGRAEILARHGVGSGEWAAIDEWWRRRLEGDPNVRTRWNSVIQDHRSRRRGGA